MIFYFEKSKYFVFVSMTSKITKLPELIKDNSLLIFWPQNLNFAKSSFFFFFFSFPETKCFSYDYLFIYFQCKWLLGKEIWLHCLLGKHWTFVCTEENLQATVVSSRNKTAISQTRHKHHSTMCCETSRGHGPILRFLGEEHSISALCEGRIRTYFTQV